MRIKTSLDRRNRIRQEVSYCIRVAIDKRLTHSELLDLVDNYVYNHWAWTTVPQWVQSYVRAFLDGQLSMIWSHFVHWRVRLDGKLILGDSVPKGEWHRVEEGDHVWNSNPSKLWTVKQ